MRLTHIINNRVCPKCKYGRLNPTGDLVFDYRKIEKLYGYPRPVDVAYYAPISECDTCKSKFIHKKRSTKEIL